MSTASVPGRRKCGGQFVRASHSHPRLARRLRSCSNGSSKRRPPTTSRVSCGKRSRSSQREGCSNPERRAVARSQPRRRDHRPCRNTRPVTRLADRASVDRTDFAFVRYVRLAKFAHSPATPARPPTSASFHENEGIKEKTYGDHSVRYRDAHRDVGHQRRGPPA
jgi:hypothetical protein